MNIQEDPKVIPEDVATHSVAEPKLGPVTVPTELTPKEGQPLPVS